MEEQQGRRNVGEIEPVGGQPSRNSGQTGLGPEEHTIDMDEISDEDWFESLRTAEESTQSQSQWPRIPKVPQMLRRTQDFKKFYEPRVISIGPYHHGEPNLFLGEKFKLPCAQIFLADSNQDTEALYTKIRSNIEAVKKCYDCSTKKYNDEKLARMMLLDGCFLLQFIRGEGMRKFIGNHQINFVMQDLFLLENQLPFGVLKLIFEGANFQGGLPMEKNIKEFITCFGMPAGLSSEIQLEEVNEEPSHLHDLLRSALLGRFKMIRRSQPEQEQQPEEKGKSSSSQGGKGGLCCPWQKGKQRGIWQSFRHIKELKAAGIYLKPSRTCFLRDISFKSYFFFGYLKLPPITIDDFTKTKFLNMVAYENCSEDTSDDRYAVTSYVGFLYELIYDADDVKELRSKHILYNYLGSDEDVAQIFNEIGNDLVDPDAYGDMKARIRKHYYKRVNSWIAGGLQEYFRYPWSLTGFIAAVWILILTSLQTYYAHPGKQMMIIYMGLFGVPIFLLVVWFIVWLLWD